MGGDVACPCRPRNVVITMRRHNRSAFNGYKWTPSDYSEVQCRTCGHHWRSKARWVDAFPDGTFEPPTAAQSTIYFRGLEKKR